MDFILLVLVTGVLFIRPTDFVPGLEIPLYNIVIVGSLLLSWNKLAPQVSRPGMRQRPILVYMIGLLLVATISNMLHGDFEGAFNFAVEFVKVILFFLLLVGVLDSPRRLRWFLGYLVGIDLVPTSLAILHYHGVIDIPAFTPLDSGGLRRLMATGNFADPNDFCEILNPAILFCLYGLMDPRRGRARFLWLAPMVVFGHALSLTQSRGGFVGLSAGLMVLLWARYGLRKSILLAALALPLLFVLFGGRMTSIDTSEGTAQGRIQIWADALELMRRSPLFGIGTEKLADFIGKVAHNSFVGVYTEAGFLGGTFYFGTFYFALMTLGRLGSTKVRIRESEIQRVRPYIMAAVASYAACEMSLTHPYSVPTYAMLGLATVVILLADPEPPVRDSRLDGRLVRRLFVASALFLAGLFLYVRMSVRW